MSADPLTLPPVRRGEARAARARCAPRAALFLPDIDRSIAFDPTGEGRCGPDPVSVGLTWGEQAFVVRCPREVIDGLLSAFDAGVDGPGLPPDAAALLLEAALLPVLERAERATGRDIRLLELRPDAGPVPPGGLGLSLDGGERRWGLHVAAGEAGRDAVAELLSVWPAAPRAMARLPFPAAVRIGTTRLALWAIRSLCPGDAVLLEVGRGGGGMLVVGDAWLAEANRDGDGWHLSGALRPARSRDEVEWTMQDEDDVKRDAEFTIDVDELPVRLGFDVGRLDIALGELRRLNVGSIIELGRGAEDIVRISANGRLIGQGTLVDVEGKVGVRIVRMLDNG